jgi:hypothetical protein
LQQVINDYRQGIASDRQLQQAYASAMTQYERGLYESYRAAQQEQQQTTIPADVPPETAPPYQAGERGGVYGPYEPPPPPMQLGEPSGRAPGPGGIFPIGPDPRVDYYSVPPYAPPTAAPPTTAPPSTAPPYTAPPSAPGAQPPSAPSPQAPLGPIPSTAPTIPGGGLGGAPVDVSYFGGTDPVVQQIAQMYGVNLSTALMLLQIMQQTGQAIPAMQYGGSPQAGQPVLVGERGPEVFTPDVPGTIAPMLPVPTDEQIRAGLRPPVGPPLGTNWAINHSDFNLLPYPYQKATREAEFQPVLSPYLRIKPEAWERYLREQPPPSRVEHRKKGE